MTRVVVIGGDAAGMSAAATAGRGVEPVDLLVFEKGAHTSYAACGLPYFVGGLVADSDSLVVRTPEQHRANGIDVRIGHEVTEIDLDRREVAGCQTATGTDFRESFDHLVIAVGASPIRPPFPNIDARGIFGIQTIPDAESIDETIRSRAPRHVVVVGGGYIGLEMIEAFLLRGLAVTVVEQLAQPMATIDPDMGARVAEGLRSMGVELRLGSSVTGFEQDADGWVRAVGTDTAEVPADLVVMGLGVRPNVKVAADAGIRIGPSGGIATDARMQTSAPEVWAAGDCVESLHRVSQRPVSIALGTHASKQGRVVGLNVSGTPARFPGVIGTAVTKVGDIEIGRTGLNEREAAAAGFVTVTATIEGSSRAHYYPDGAPLTVKIVAEHGSGRLLGVQIVGGPESAKRIDAMAVAVWNEMRVDDVAQLDLGYAPPFSPVWDSTLIAARRAGDRLR